MALLCSEPRCPGVRRHEIGISTNARLVLACLDSAYNQFVQIICKLWQGAFASTGRRMLVLGLANRGGQIVALVPDPFGQLIQVFVSAESTGHRQRAALAYAENMISPALHPSVNSTNHLLKDGLERECTRSLLKWKPWCSVMTRTRRCGSIRTEQSSTTGRSKGENQRRKNAYEALLFFPLCSLPDRDARFSTSSTRCTPPPPPIRARRSAKVTERGLFEGIKLRDLKLIAESDDII